jgi:uncharacterized protein YdeI (YjbR/CyaY-like superfamily)
MRTRKHVEVPQELEAALRAQRGALAVFERMRPSCQGEYAGHVAEAAKPGTRARRAEQAVRAVLAWGRRHPGPASRKAPR